MEIELPIDTPLNGVFINYISGHPPLQRMAFVSIAAILWNKPNVRHFIHETWKEIDFISYYSLETCLYNAKEILLLELAKVHIPPLLRKKLEKIISGFGFHLFNFLIDIDKNHANMDVFLGQKIPIYFKMGGRIDKAKTLNALMIYETNPANFKQNTCKFELFKLACHYCLEEYVSVLWLSLNKNEQNLIEQAYHKNDLVPYWIAVQKNELSSFVKKAPRHDPRQLYDQNLNYYENRVSFSIYEGNELAFKYFWDILLLGSKIPHTLIDQWLKILQSSHSMNLNWALKFTVCTHAYILCFLLSQDSIYQKKFFRNPIFFTLLLNCLYYVWPLQKYYLPTMVVMLSHHLQDNNPGISDTTCVEYKAIQKGKTKEEVFTYVWSICPSKVQKEITKRIKEILGSTPEIILQIMGISKNVVWLLLNDATYGEKNDIVWRMVEQFSFYLLLPSKLDLMDELLSNILRDNDAVLEFKIKAGIQYANKYLKNGQYDCRIPLKLLEGFITWAFPSDIEISNLNEISERTEMSDYLDQKLEIFTALIIYNNYELANQFLNQYIKSKSKISMYKIGWMCKEGFVTVQFLLTAFCRMGENGWERFQTFLKNFSFAGILAKFKRRHLKRLTLITLLNLSYRFKSFIFITKLLDWGFNSRKKLIIFKNKLMIEPDLLNDFYNNLLKLVRYDSNTDWMNLKEKIIWFQPYKETLEDLKRSLILNLLSVETCEECGCICMRHNKKEIFLHLLDCLPTEENSNPEGSIPQFNLEDVLVIVSSENFMRRSTIF